MLNFSLNADLPAPDFLSKEVKSIFETYKKAMVEKFRAECNGFMQKWADSAAEKIKTPEKYIQHIFSGIKRDETTNEGHIFMVEHAYNTAKGTSITMLLEDGFDPFDMKERMLSGNVKMSKKGFVYKVIPFTYFNPETLKADKISVEQKQALDELEKMGFTPMLKKNLLEKAGFKPDEITKLLGDMKVKSGELRIAGLPKESTVTRKYYYQWKNPQFDKLKKQFKKASDTFQTHKTFRTMTSAANQSGAWIHPGLRPLNIFRSVYTKEKEAIPARMAIYHEEFIKGLTGS